MRISALTAAIVAMCLLSASCAVANLADSSWPAFQGGSKNSGYSPISVAGNTLQWENSSGGQVSVSPDGTIYAVGKGKLTAINKDGSTKWQYNSGHYYGDRAAAIGSDGTIYFAAYNPWQDERFYAINPDGSLKWSCQISCSYGTTSPNIDSQGNVYIAGCASNTCILYSLTGDTGQLRWSRVTSNPWVGGAIAIGANDTVYVPVFDWDDGAAVSAYDSDGNLKWRGRTGGVYNNGPAIGPDGTIYTGDTEGPPRMIAIGPDGTKLWLARAGDGITGTPAVTPDGTVYAVSNGGSLFAYKNGLTLWQFTPEGITSGQYQSPIVDGSGTILYVGKSGKSSGFVIAVNPDGTERWRTSAACGDKTNLALGANGELYVGGSSVTCFVPEPSSVLVLLCGITGTATLAMRRRK